MDYSRKSARRQESERIAHLLRALLRYYARCLIDLWRECQALSGSGNICNKGKRKGNADKLFFMTIFLKQGSAYSH